MEEPAQTVGFPLILPGVEGVLLVVTLRLRADEEPQTLFAMTEIVPPLDPVVVLIELVVDVPAHPPGNDHVYDVAPETDATLYEIVEPAHGLALPVMLPGVAGIFVTVTFKVCAEEGPQVLLAVTLIVPPALPAVALIEFVVDAPVQPTGKVHV